MRRPRPWPPIPWRWCGPTPPRKSQDITHWILAWKRLDEATGHRGLAPRFAPRPAEDPDGQMAAEITASLRRLDPKDPLKYDFALSHLGILGDCPRVRTLPRCAPCPLVGLCKAGKP